MTTTLRRSCTHALTFVGAVTLAASTLVVAAPTAGAAPLPTSPTSTSSPGGASTATAPGTYLQVRPAATFGSRVVSIVASRHGSPYVYGAAGPHAFDCSGLTMWTFGRLGRYLPHNAAAQYGRVRHIRASDRRPGDLVFFFGSGGIYHVAIYAGHNEIWHAPYPGTSVREERLWTGAVAYGRIG